MGVLDKTLFLACRAEHYFVVLVCLAVAARRRRSGSPACKLVWCFIWFWAATSKLNDHFPSVIMFMMNNGPFFPKCAEEEALHALPRRPAPVALATFMAHIGHRDRVLDPGRAARSSQNQTADRRCPAADGRLPRLHRDQQPERHAGRVEHPDDLRRLLPVRLPPRGAARSRRCRDAASCSRSCSSRSSSCRLLGNFFPSQVSFLLSMRYYAGNWAYNIWLVRKGSAEKFDEAEEGAPARCASSSRSCVPDPTTRRGRASRCACAPLHALRGTAAARGAAARRRRHRRLRVARGRGARRHGARLELRRRPPERRAAAARDPAAVRLRAGRGARRDRSSRSRSSADDALEDRRRRDAACVDEGETEIARDARRSSPGRPASYAEAFAAATGARPPEARGDGGGASTPS